MAYKSGVILGIASINTGGVSATSIGSGTASGAINIGNSSSGLVRLDCGISGFSVGATPNAHATVVGSSNSTSSLNMQVAAGSFSISAANGPIVIKSGTGNIIVSGENSDSTISVATGAGAKAVVVGSVNGASPMAVRCGTGGFSLSSASGILMNTFSTGETTFPIQAAFLARKTAAQVDVIGNNASAYVGYSTEIYDHGSNYDGVNTFTAPVAGRYFFNAVIFLDGVTASSTEIICRILCSNRFSARLLCSLALMRTGSKYRSTMSVLFDMDAGDIANVNAYGGGMASRDIDFATDNLEFFYGKLVC